MGDSERSFYTPDEFGDLFGNTPRPPIGPSGDGQPPKPEAVMRIFYGQDPAIQQEIDLARHDNLLSAFPNVEEGAKLLETILPQFMDECLGNDGRISESIGAYVADPEKFVKQILFDFFTGNTESIEAGGQETMYISNQIPNMEQSYEYIGEQLTRIFRGLTGEDDRKETKAFFGWIGRRVMKQIQPATDFSLDRHTVMVAEERRELMDTIHAFTVRLDKGIKGDITKRKVRKFFRELGRISQELPRSDSAETPLQTRIGGKISFDFNDILFESLEDSLPYAFDKRHSLNGDNTFENFLKNWRQKPNDEGQGGNCIEYYKEDYPDIFEDIPSGDDEARAVSEDVLFRKWFIMVQRQLKEGMTKIAEDAQRFDVSYFRFIRNEDVSKGYAYAQMHWDEIHSILPEIFRMTDAEIHERFMQGDPHILFDRLDTGENSADDMYRDVDFEDIERSMRSEESMPTDALPIELSPEEKNYTDEDWLNLIQHGANADLYVFLEHTDIFAREEWHFGIVPLFFGNWLSDRKAYFVDHPDESKAYYGRLHGLPQIEWERERIAELRAGEFSLPKSFDDLIINANRQIARLEKEYEASRENVSTFNARAIIASSLLKSRLIALKSVRNQIWEMM